MPGPYFTGQKPEVCGCYFPDVALVRDDEETGSRHYFCTTHHEVVQEGGSEGLFEPEAIPDEAWREMMRDILRRGGN